MAGPDWQKVVDANFTDQRAFLGKISDSAKFIWAGSFALFYSAMIADKPPLATFYANNKDLLFYAAEFGALAFLLDILKNWFGAELSKDLIKLIIENFSAADLQARYSSQVSDNTYGSANRLLFIGSTVSALISACLIAICVYNYYKL